MPAQRLVMRQVREVLRLKWACGLSDRKIAQSLRVSRPTVAEYVRRAQAAGYPGPCRIPSTIPPWRDDCLRRLPTPHGAAPSTCLGHRPPGAQTQGCHLALVVARIQGHHPRRPAVQPILSGVSPVGWEARSRHAAEPPGETLFVDYAGQTMPVINALTGEVREAAIFIAVLGPSNIPLPKRPGARVSPIGLGPMSAPLRRWVGCPRSWSPIISRPP